MTLLALGKKLVGIRDIFGELYRKKVWKKNEIKFNSGKNKT